MSDVSGDNFSGRSDQTRQSPKASRRKSIFKTLLQKKSPSRKQPSSASSSTSTSPKQLTRNSSVRSFKANNANVGSVIDTEDISIYNSEDDINDIFETEDADVDVSDISSESSTFVRRGSTALDKNHTIDESLVQSFEHQLLKMLNPQGIDDCWENFKYESLMVPNYMKPTRRTKNSPTILKRLFLAQELNQSSDSSDSDNVDSLSVDKTLVHTRSNESSKSMKLAIGSKISKEIFVMRFSLDGKYLAVAGRDSVIKVWKVICSPLGRMEYNNQTQKKPPAKSNKNHDNIVFEHAPVFHPTPVRIFKGHVNSILTLDWSKNNFLISGSMDKTVKLWHVDKPKALASFTHTDFITTVKFHPNDDRFFLSGSLDNQVRLWSILEKLVAFSQHLGDDMLITSSTFTPDGLHCIVGGFNGTLVALEIKGLHVLQRFDIKRRSLVSNSYNDGNKVTSITVFQNTESGSQEDNLFEKKWSFLITTNDSKIRLVHFKDKKLVTRFKGSTNSGSIEACISDDYQYVLSASEDHWVYLWENNNAIINNKLKNALKDIAREGKHHLQDIPVKHKKYYDFILRNKLIKKLNIHQFLNDPYLDLVSNENSSYTSFHAHHSNVNSAIFAPNKTKKLLELSDDLIFDLIKRSRICQKVSQQESVSIPDENSIENGNEGMIIVTTDDYGLIRVFRHDPAHAIRNSIIQMYKKSKFKDKDGNNYEEILLALSNKKHSSQKGPGGINCPSKKSKSAFKSKEPQSESSFEFPELTKSPSLPNTTPRKKYTSTRSRPPLKSISNGILGPDNATLAILTQMPISRSISLMKPNPNSNNYVGGVITPEEDVSFVSPGKSSQLSPKQSPRVPFIVNTDPNDNTKVLSFQIPVTRLISFEDVKDFKFTSAKKK